MHVPRGPRRLKNVAQDLDASLARLKVELALGDAEWREALGLSPTDFRKYAERRIELPFSSLHRVSEAYHLSIESIVNNEIDYPTLIAHRQGRLETVPEQFLRSATTKRRMLSYLLAQAEARFGWQFRRFILKRFQLTEAALLDPEALVNILLMMRVVGLMRDSGLGLDQFQAMGAETLRAFPGSILERELRNARTAEELYAKLVDELMPFFGVSCDYRLLRVVKGESLVVGATDRPDILETFRLPHLASPEGCSFRSGMFRSMPGFAKLPYSEVREIKCAHRGDAGCEYEVVLRKPIKIVD